MTGVSISCVVLVRLAGQLALEVVQAGDDRSVEHFVPHLHPDAADQRGINLEVDLQFASVAGVQALRQTACLRLRQGTRNADRRNPALLALGGELGETAHEPGCLDATGLRDYLSDQDLCFLTCERNQPFGQGSLCCGAGLRFRQGALHIVVGSHSLVEGEKIVLQRFQAGDSGGRNGRRQAGGGCVGAAAAVAGGGGGGGRGGGPRGRPPPPTPTQQFSSRALSE